MYKLANNRVNYIVTIGQRVKDYMVMSLMTWLKSQERATLNIEVADVIIMIAFGKVKTQSSKKHRHNSSQSNAKPFRII